MTNAASAAASKVRVRLTTDGCTTADKNEKELGKPLAKGSGLDVSWRVQPEAGKACQLKLEVIAQYTIPDLQYAQATRTFTPKAVEPPKKPQTKQSDVTNAVTSTSNLPANTGGGHWERGAPEIGWPYGPPTDAKTGKKLGNVPSGGESWFSGGSDSDHQWSNTIESAGPSEYAYHSFALVDPKGFNYHYTGSWTLPPSTLIPGQKFTMQVTSGEYGGASCYTWEREQTNNSHWVEATRGNPSVTSQPYTIPDGGKNAQFGFFCGTSILKWVYTYHWVGGGGN